MSFSPTIPMSLASSEFANPSATVDLDRYHERIITVRRGILSKPVVARLDQLLCHEPAAVSTASVAVSSTIQRRRHRSRPWTWNIEDCRLPSDGDDDEEFNTLRHAASARIGSLTVRMPSNNSRNHRHPHQILQMEAAMAAMETTIAIPPPGPMHQYHHHHHHHLPPHNNNHNNGRHEQEQQRQANDQAMQAIAAEFGGTEFVSEHTNMVGIENETTVHPNEQNVNNNGQDDNAGGGGDGGGDDDGIEELENCPQRKLISALFRPESFEVISTSLEQLTIRQWRTNTESVDIMRQYLAKTIKLSEFQLDLCHVDNMGTCLARLFSDAPYRPKSIELGGMEQTNIGNDDNVDGLSLSSVFAEWPDFIRLRIRSSNLQSIPGLERLVQLQKLELVRIGIASNNFFMPHQHPMMMMTMPATITSATGPTTFSLSTSGILHLLQNPDCQLVELDLQASKISEECLIALFREDVLGSNRSLQKLNLHNVVLRSASFHAMTTYLCDFGHRARLRELKIGGQPQHYHHFNSNGNCLPTITTEWISHIHDALRTRNICLERLSIPSTLLPSPMALYELDPYLVRNWAGGRRLWSDDIHNNNNNGSSSSSSSSLWPLILSRVHSQAVEDRFLQSNSTSNRLRSSKTLCVDTIYSLLREGIGRGMVSSS